MPFDDAGFLPSPVEVEQPTEAVRILDGMIELLSDKRNWSRWYMRKRRFGIVGRWQYCVHGALVELSGVRARSANMTAYCVVMTALYQVRPSYITWQAKASHSDVLAFLRKAHASLT